MTAVDWNAGRYEQIAPELEPVAREVVARAAPLADRALVDLACGDGNAALLAAAARARVIGVDAAARLVGLARERARAAGLEDARFVVGDLAATGLDEGAADVVVSVFGIIFAADPAAALREAARITRPGGRLLVSAWVPAGPIDAMLGAFGATVARLTGSRPPERLAWSDAAAVEPLAARAGLALERTESSALEIRAASPAAYVAHGERCHPMSLAMWPAIERAGEAERLRAQMTDVLSAANEDPDAFCVHSPYVIHELRRAG